MPQIIDPYLRTQLEQRRERLQSAISTVPAAQTPQSTAPLFKLLSDVDSAIQRMDDGTYGLCDVCHDPVEKERLIADPLARLCLDHLTSDEQRALERDLELASSVQRGLLPPADLHHRDWRVHYHYQPAGIVSGDYCDLILDPREDGKLIFLLGDVAGKGVAASLLMTHLHAMFRALAGIGLELDALLEMANRVFCESTFAGQYATLICGRAAANGEIEIASAGHLPAVLTKKSGTAQFEATGLPLGLFATTRYTVHRMRLEPGDTLLLYTDGISEATNSAGAEYGITGVTRSTAAHHGADAQSLVAVCLADVANHSGAQRPSDDQTLMAIHRAAA